MSGQRAEPSTASSVLAQRHDALDSLDRCAAKLGVGDRAVLQRAVAALRSCVLASEAESGAERALQEALLAKNRMAAELAKTQSQLDQQAGELDELLALQRDALRRHEEDDGSLQDAQAQASARIAFLEQALVEAQEQNGALQQELDKKQQLLLEQHGGARTMEVMLNGQKLIVEQMHAENAEAKVIVQREGDAERHRIKCVQTIREWQERSRETAEQCAARMAECVREETATKDRLSAEIRELQQKIQETAVHSQDQRRVLQREVLADMQQCEEQIKAKRREVHMAQEELTAEQAKVSTLRTQYRGHCGKARPYRDGLR